MKRILPVEELARDERFQRIRIEEVVFEYEPVAAAYSYSQTLGIRQSKGRNRCRVAAGRHYVCSDAEVRLCSDRRVPRCIRHRGIA